jgi:hypothetical protein
MPFAMGVVLVTVQNLRKDKDSRANAGLQTAGTQMGADLFVGKVKAYLEKRPTQKGISFGVSARSKRSDVPEPPKALCVRPSSLLGGSRARSPPGGGGEAARTASLARTRSGAERGVRRTCGRKPG